MERLPSKTSYLKSTTEAKTSQGRVSPTMEIHLKHTLVLGFSATGSKAWCDACLPAIMI